MAGDTGVEEGVGLTALMVAAARAIETHRHDALARDVYAEHFVRAARASADWPVRPHQVPDGDADPLWGRLGRYFGLRTRVLDDFILRQVSAGARQVVLLGAGLDTRAYRLDWPPGCRVFELDQEEVLAFKGRVLGGLRAVPKTERVPIAADLRLAWAGALTGAGFDPAAPTVWLAEGVLLYLPHAAERAMIEAVDALSVAGSALAYEIKLAPESAAVQESPIYTVARRTGIDLLAMFPLEPRPDSAGDLTARGWRTSVHTAFDFTRRHGRGPEAQPGRPDALAANRWVFADRP
ncbi:class I SAM-dependent methyltransferase [Actinoallomurus iriomotensis]|uniref:S-adenosyl-L-methionine-dependent methyltransferase n=1 Tax=Actinoallomurus iriomotensis TaxID=478107 RepID=A0A9W6RX12_9ACTN|nr:class I SAM-dependent methyltransferase [Actinoallomurus iriomotensis]GLY81687.1 putative S-adenosyl-L-methionine-dependent methyltransferase [Actinoallomurus iriomotensis]